MIIRLTKATRFLIICALLLVTALIGIGTRSVTVSAPYTSRSQAMPVIVYRAVDGESPAAVPLRQLEDDLDFLLHAGYSALGEPELVAALRRQATLPGHAVLLLFDNTCERFARDVLPLLEERELAWIPVEKSGVLTRELRAAGHSVARYERTPTLTLEEQLGN
ncbi:MAG: hypothetical protein FWB76_05770 [Oscillospiraceae bacterium]|nr:hypothetical protein [Oscillospiraceae bacterium]